MYPQVLSIEIGKSLGSAAKSGTRKKNSSSYASSLAFSPQGNYITADFDGGEFWFWDFATEEVLYQARGDGVDIGSIVFSPDGQLIYYCFRNGHIRIWDVKTKESINESYHDIFEGKCRGCTISSDGCYAAFATDLYALLLCDRKSRQKLMEFNTAFYPRHIFSPNGDMLAFFGDSETVCLWDTRRQSLIHSWAERFHVALALSDKYIAFQRDADIEIWDIHALARIRKLEAGLFSHICFAGDQYLFSSSNKICIIWNISTGEPIVESYLGDWVRSISASSDLKYIAVGTENGTVHVGPLDTPIQWKVSDISERGRLLKRCLRSQYLIQVYKFFTQEDDKEVIQISDTTTEHSIVFETSVRRSRNQLQIVQVFSRNERLYVAYITAGRLGLWNDMEGEFILDESAGAVTSLEFSAVGDRLVSGDKHGVIKLWDVDTRALIGGPYTAPERVYALSFSTNRESFLVAYGRPKEGGAFIEVRECQSGRILNGPLKSAQPPPHLILSPLDLTNSIDSISDTVTFSSRETRIMWISRSHIEFWDALTGERVTVNPYIDGGKHSDKFAVSPNRKYIAWALGGLQIWDIDDGVLLREMPLNGYISDLLISDDSSRVAAVFTHPGYGGHYIGVWDVSIGAQIYTCRWELTVRRHLLSINGNRLMISDQPFKVLNLDVYETMSHFYEDNSHFGRSHFVDDAKKRW